MVNTAASLVKLLSHTICEIQLFNVFQVFGLFGIMKYRQGIFEGVDSAKQHQLVYDMFVQCLVYAE